VLAQNFDMTTYTYVTWRLSTLHYCNAVTAVAVATVAQRCSRVQVRQGLVLYHNVCDTASVAPETLPVRKCCCACVTVYEVDAPSYAHTNCAVWTSSVCTGHASICSHALSTVSSN
jgi:hypothetical protein